MQDVLAGIRDGHPEPVSLQAVLLRPSSIVFCVDEQDAGRPDVGIAHT
jgi:hypothetical protein